MQKWKEDAEGAKACLEDVVATMAAPENEAWVELIPEYAANKVQGELLALSAARESWDLVLAAGETADFKDLQRGWNSVKAEAREAKRSFEVQAKEAKKLIEKQIKKKPAAATE